MAKGTLCLYFPTREEVLIVLCSERFERLKESLTDGLEPGMSDLIFIDHFFARVRADSALLALLG